MDPETVERAVKRARKNHERLSQHLGEVELCDCDKCYQIVTEPRPISTVKKHRQRYGNRRITSGAGPSSSRHVLSPPPLPLGVNKVDKYPDDQYNPDHALDLDDELGDDKLEKNELEHDDMVNSGAHAAKSGAGPISHSTSQTRAQSRSQTCSLSRSPARPHADFPNQQLHSPSRSRSRTRSSTGPGDAPDFRLVNHEEDAAFYANLLEDNNLARPPPFGVGNGSEASEEEGGRGGDHEEEGEGGERGDDGSDDGDGEPDLGQNQAPGQREPAIFVPQEFGDNPGDPDDEHVGPMAFAEDPVLRNIYLRTWVQAAFHGATHNAIQAMLESHKLTLQATANLRPQELVEEVEKMPTTLRSLERRLSINFSDLIIIFVLCPTCGMRYTLEEIENAETPQCHRLVNDDQCEGVLFTESTLADGTRKRTPKKSFPYISIIRALERLLCRPGMLELMQHWRREGDEAAENVPPLQRQDWMDAVPLDHRFGDISEAWFWRAQPAGLRRAYDAAENYYGDEPTGDETLSLARLPIGLSLGMNMDGFRAFRGKHSVSGSYSVNGVYIVVNNLPFYLRTLIENMLLVLVIPGPNEPTGFTLDQILQPLVDDLIRLTNGVDMRVFNRATGQTELRKVYATLSALFLDWQARIKCTGHAGLTAEENHCLYCTMRTCYLAFGAGYQPEDYEMRDPVHHLQLKYEWLRAAAADRRRLFQENGTRFHELDRLPGFYSIDCCPVDGMHLFDEGITPALVRVIIYQCGMLRKRWRNQPEAETPESRFNAFVARTYFPSNCSRLPPSLDKMGTNMKAAQWRTLLLVLPGALFEAWRVGDAIPPDDIPRGEERSSHFKAQQREAAKMLARRINAHNLVGGDPDDEPQLEDCTSSRNPRDYYRNCMRYFVAYQGLFKHRLTRTEIEDMSALLAQFARTFARMNVHLVPSFHSATHIGGHLLKYGNIFGTWMYDFERANRVLININTNGHGNGTLEATMARGFLRRAECYQLVRYMQSIEQPSADDIATTKALLKVMRDGPEHEAQRGRLNAILAGDARFQRVRLSTTPAKVNFRRGDDVHYYDLFIRFCSNQGENIVIYGDGVRPPGGIYLDPKTSTVSYSHFFYFGIRYGVAAHHRGKRSRYGFIENRIPVIIRKVYEATLQVEGAPQRFIGVVIQRFVRPRRQPVFPWDNWADRLGIGAWVYNEFEAPEVVHPSALNGVFALSDLEMTYGHYWITFAMIHTEPNDLADDLD